MCLPDFIEFKQIDINKPVIGYRSWRLEIKSPDILLSEHQDYRWNRIIEGPHEVLDVNSGIYSYNNNNYNNYYNNNYNNNYNNYNYYYNNYYNYYNNNYNNYNNYNNNYYILGIIEQYGKLAVHKTGYRSEFAKTKMLFTIKESNADGPQKFLAWIKQFNHIIIELSKKYECNTIAYQDFIDNQKS